MNDTLDTLVRAVGDAGALSFVCWIIVIGGVGAAIGAQYGHPTMGFFVSVLCPIPILGWIIVTRLSTMRRLRPSNDDDLFADLLPPP